MSIGSGVRGLTTRTKDALRYSNAVRGALLALSALASRASPTRVRRATHLIKAYGLASHPSWTRRLALRLTAIRQLSDNELLQMTRKVWGWANLEQPLDRAIVLKAPGPGGERGVLLSFAEYNWLRLIQRPEVVRQLGEQYTLVLTAGWSPLDYALVESVLRRVKGTIFVQACNRAEVERIHSFSPRLICLPTLGCDWINPDLDVPKPRNRRGTDIVMVANWAPFKRHWHLFEALRSLPDNTRVRLIGQPDGPHALERVQRQARDFGVKQHVEYYDRLPVDQVRQHLADARISIILSRHEGYCGAVTESLFSDTPVGLLEDAYIGSKDYINRQTGVLLPGRGLGLALAAFLDQASIFQPREWAVEHISCHRSLARLNAVLTNHALLEGRPWTTDVSPFCWRPYPTLIEVTDSVRQAADDLQTRFPETFGSGLLTPRVAARRRAIRTNPIPR